MTPAALFRLFGSGVEIAGIEAPRVLADYAKLTYANRLSRQKPSASVPPAMGFSPLPTRPVDVIVPVYNNYDDTSALLGALAAGSPLGGSIILVHDASTDERIGSLLRHHAQTLPNARLIENERNLGFVQTCNRGFAASRNDVIILNTDIGLPRGALNSLAGWLQSRDDIATVTPRSNSAYGVGFPTLVFGGDLAFGADVETMNALCQATAAGVSLDLPTGIGFCMAISRDALNRLGAGFDTYFGQGYGEETDLCQRAFRLGLRNVLAADVFVAHKGGQSFGGDWQDRSRRGLLKVLLRHAGYAPRVSAYLAASELSALNFALSVALCERLSGSRARLMETGSVAHSIPNEPTIVVDARADGAWQADVMWAGEVHTYVFGSRVILEAALERGRAANSQADLAESPNRSPA